MIQIELDVLRVENMSLDIVLGWEILWFIGKSRNRVLLQDHQLKLSIRAWGQLCLR